MDADVEAWGTHVAGAAAIVRARGEEILDSPRGLALFRVTRTQMVPYLPTTGPVTLLMSPSSSRTAYEVKVALPNCQSREDGWLTSSIYPTLLTVWRRTFSYYLNYLQKERSS